LTAFNTRLPPRNLLQQDGAAGSTAPGSSSTGAASSPSLTPSNTLASLGLDDETSVDSDNSQGGVMRGSAHLDQQQVISIHILFLLLCFINCGLKLCRFGLFLASKSLKKWPRASLWMQSTNNWAGDSNQRLISPLGISSNSLPPLLDCLWFACKRLSDWKCGCQIKSCRDKPQIYYSRFASTVSRMLRLTLTFWTLFWDFAWR